jgi:hypothetical protein
MCLVNKQTIVGVQKFNNGFILWHNVAKNRVLTLFYLFFMPTVV